MKSNVFVMFQFYTAIIYHAPEFFKSEANNMFTNIAKSLTNIHKKAAYSCRDRRRTPKHSAGKHLKKPTQTHRPQKLGASAHPSRSHPNGQKNRSKNITPFKLSFVDFTTAVAKKQAFSQIEFAKAAFFRLSFRSAEDYLKTF